MLAFPEPGVDDTAAYQGYQTRFYRDSKGNTVQIYLEPRGGRVVNLWADAADESLGFTVRDMRGRPARLTWAADSAETGDSGGMRTLEYRLTAESPSVTLGWFVLGSMRVERDFQYGQLHLRPYGAAPYQVAEESLLVANVARLPAGERQRQLELLGANSVAALRSRLQPRLAGSCSAAACTVQVGRPSLDGRNRLVLEAARRSAGDSPANRDPDGVVQVPVGPAGADSRSASRPTPRRLRHSRATRSSTARSWSFWRRPGRRTRPRGAPAGWSARCGASSF